MKKIPLILCACLGIAYQGYAQGGLRADGAVTIRTSGTVNIVTNSNIQVNTGATLNASSNSVIKLNGVNQNLNFGASTTLGNLQLSGGGNKTLQQAVTVATNVDFSGGAKLVLGANNLTLSQSATVTNASTANGYIVATSTGTLLHSYNGAANKVFPLGDASNYTPLSLNMTAATGTGTVSANVVGGSRYTNADASNYLNRYWNVNINGLTSVNGSLSGEYVTGELIGTNVKAAYYNGSSWVYNCTNIAGSPTPTVVVPNLVSGTFSGTIAAAAPTISAMSVTTGSVDTRITLTGSGFTPSAVFKINGTDVRRVWYYDATKVIIQVNDNTSSGLVTVSNGCNSNNGGTFTINNCNAPTGVGATTSTTTTGIDVSWTNPTAANRVDVIYRIVGSNAEFTRINTSKITAGAQTHVINSLAPNTNYEVYVQIRCDATNWSNWVLANANVSSGNVGGAASTCAKPTVTAPANNTVLAAQQGNFSWNAVTNATSYQVFIVEVDGATPPIPVSGTSQTWNTTNTSYTVNFLKPSTKYRFQVRAICASGTSEYSNELFVTTASGGTACNPPTTVNATVSGTAGSPADLNITWSGDSGASGSPKYTVHIRLPDGTIHPKTSDTQGSTWGGFEGGQTYEYSVRTNCASGAASNFSPWQSITIPGTYGSCSPITAVNVTAIKSWGAMINWTPAEAGNAPKVGRSYWVQYWNTTDPSTIYTIVTDSTKIQLLVGTHSGILANQTYAAKVWYLCGGQLQSFMTSSPANFTLTGSQAEKGGFNTQNTIAANSLEVYPNPANQSTTISYQAAHTSSQINLLVVDALGREVYRETTQGSVLKTNLNVGKLAAGVYLIKVQEGNQTLTKKLIVE